jgi:hypothetical protein
MFPDVEGSCDYVEKESQTAKKGWSSGLEVGPEADKSSL